MHEPRAQGALFAFETTLAGRSHARFLCAAQRLGCAVHVAYLWRSSPDLAAHRVAVRVQAGGHASSTRNSEL